MNHLKSSDPDISLRTKLLPGLVGFSSSSIWEGMKIQTLPSKRTRTTTLIEVLTGLLTVKTHRDRNINRSGDPRSMSPSGQIDRGKNPGEPT